MGLKYQLDNLDSVSDAAIQALYTEQDGKYVLDIDGLPEAEDTTALKTALQRERANVKKLEKSLTGFKAIGDDPDAIKAMMDDLKEAGSGDGGGKVTESKEYLLLQKQLEAAQAENGQLKETTAAATEASQKTIKKFHLQSALAKAKAFPDAMDLVIDRLMPHLAVDGDSISVTESDGETPMIGSQKDGTATVDDLVKAVALSKWPMLFEGDGAGGSGKQPGAGGSGAKGKTISRSAYENLAPNEQAAKMQAGFTLTDG